MTAPPAGRIGPSVLLRAADDIVDAVTDADRALAIDVYRQLRIGRHDVAMSRAARSASVRPWHVVDLLRNHGQMPIPRIAQRLGVSISTAQRALRPLLAYNLVVKVVITDRFDVRYCLASPLIGAVDIVSALEPTP